MSSSSLHIQRRSRCLSSRPTLFKGIRSHPQHLHTLGEPEQRRELRVSQKKSNYIVVVFKFHHGVPVTNIGIEHERLNNELNHV